MSQIAKTRRRSAKRHRTAEIRHSRVLLQWAFRNIGDASKARVALVQIAAGVQR